MCSVGDLLGINRALHDRLERAPGAQGRALRCPPTRATARGARTARPSLLRLADAPFDRDRLRAAPAVAPRLRSAAVAELLRVVDGERGLLGRPAVARIPPLHQDEPCGARGLGGVLRDLRLPAVGVLLRRAAALLPRLPRVHGARHRPPRDCPPRDARRMALGMGRLGRPHGRRRARRDVGLREARAARLEARSARVAGRPRHRVHRRGVLLLGRLRRVAVAASRAAGHVLHPRRRARAATGSDAQGLGAARCVAARARAAAAPDAAAPPTERAAHRH